MEKTKVKIKTIKNKSVFIYLMFTMIMVIVIANKENFHVDEIFSYTLANNIGSISIDFNEGYTYAPAESIYLKQITVSDVTSQFNFKNVWKNQANDVHPPLYYLFLHTICSFSAGKFSIWQAGVINICFGLLTLYILRKLISRFSSDVVIMEFSSILFI